MDSDEYRFPPFPTPPVGVQIVPFGAFAPAGYRSVTGPSGEQVEVDAWAGVPTIKVLNEEEVAQKRKKNKKRKNAGNTTDAVGRLIPWWEEWEEGEVQRTTSEASFENYTRLEDRLCLAADDFRVGRAWPEIAHGVRLMWDQFRVYIGLLSSIPVYKKIKNKKGQVDAPNGQDASDDEGEAPKANHIKVDIVQDYLEQSALPGKQLEPSPDESTAEAQRLRTFLDDMEKTVKVFLSSHMRDTGLIWTEKNLVNAPIVLHFFLRFMLRNKVFADSKQHQDNLTRAVAVAALARKELPATAKLGQMLPGRFDIACKECWGMRGSLSLQISATVAADEAIFETELKENDIEIVPSDAVLDSTVAAQVMEDNLNPDTGDPICALGKEVTSDSIIAKVDDPNHVVEDPTRAEGYTTESWTDVSVPWLMEILGPTVLPLVVQTGIVEYSTRRIREVIRPGGGTGMQAVLGGLYFKVVMDPWVQRQEEATVDFPGPVIVPRTRAVSSNDVDPWNPYRDDLTILVDEAVAEQMVVGMGLCGTWVEMVEDEKRHGRENYWYVESLVASFPSYYTEGEGEGEGEGETEALEEEEDE